MRCVVNLDSNASYNSTFNPNFPKIDNRASGNDVRSDEALRKFLIEVGINQGIAYQIDQFFHNDIPSSNLSRKEMEWIQGYYDVISDCLFASTTNKRSGKKYDWTPVILKAYERAKTLVVVSKSIEGWATHNVLKHEVIQRLHEQSDQRLTEETRKKGWFSNNNSQSNNQVEQSSYGKFERST